MNRKNRYLWLLLSSILGGGATDAWWIVESTDAYAEVVSGSEYHRLGGLFGLLIVLGVPLTVGLMSGCAFGGTKARRSCAGMTGGLLMLSVAMLFQMVVEGPFEILWWPNAIMMFALAGLIGAAGGFGSTEISRHLQK